MAKKRGEVFLKGVDTSLHTMKPNALLHKTHIHQVLRLDMCTSIIPLSKIADQMWRDHPFSQRNKTTEEEVEVGVLGSRDGGWTKLEKGDQAI